MKALVPLVLTLAQLGHVAPAEACSWAPGPPAPPHYPWWSADGFPTNGLFSSSLEWESAGGPLVLVEDAQVSARIAMNVRRPQAPLGAGEIYTATQCSGSTPCELRVGPGPDLVPPSRAEVASLRTRLVREPQGAGAFSCPDVDSLEIIVEGTDDTTPRDLLAIGAFVGATPAEVAARSDIDVTFGFDVGPPAGPLVSTIWLGESVGRMRDGEPLRAAGPFCFSVVLIDWAGNIGDRSEARCLDTTDPDDPTVEFVDSAGCGCHAPATPGGAAPLVLAFLVVSVRSARRRRARPRS